MVCPACGRRTRRFFCGRSWDEDGHLRGCCFLGAITLWWPLPQQCLTPLLVTVHLGHGGKLCSIHVCVCVCGWVGVGGCGCW